ncbi:NAD(P)-binding domain-containing protein [Thalassobaculum sp. OXR-137]|uniref:flavin-containing monooxygenase n=1 Tax=Thalassobaculum sp. OXR-137 TaxID=3100173 RepID=UPI002AC9E8E8|nr:FAD-dependent oxidoreductase [Thalassobaculum sp. OXR-137]WPZ33154.1 NAD(P)-binding domain-containing protein [Thalassobaculum sp. OXR-137]
MTAQQDLPAIAIIGAGPSGLATARWLKAKGLDAVILEAGAGLGGQWNPDAPHSATWPGMRTNTSRVMTAFSDMDHPEGTPVYPTREQMHAYLTAYAERFDLAGAIRFGCRVEGLAQVEGGWRLDWRVEEGAQTAVFERVIVATGRQVEGALPDIPGLESFAGRLGIRHTNAYAGTADWVGASVLVAGCSISALEIAAELAHHAGEVTVAYRRQRYVLPKQIVGVPTDHVMFTRAAALMAERFPPEVVAQGLKAQVLKVAGNPADWGAQEPHENVFAAGITQSQSFLPAVSEGRIATRPWIERIDGRTVRFADGSAREVDGILFGTGYALSLPFLSPEIAATLQLDPVGMDLFAQTFHPELPGLAFVGVYELLGPYFPVVELQARWVAESLARPETLPPAEQMAQVIAATPPEFRRAPAIPMNALAVVFARLLGAEPTAADWPGLERALMLGPLSPASFRLSGPDATDDAPIRTAAAAAAFGHIVDATPTAEEQGLLGALAG